MSLFVSCLIPFLMYLSWKVLFFIWTDFKATMAYKSVLRCKKECWLFIQTDVGYIEWWIRKCSDIDLKGMWRELACLLFVSITTSHMLTAYECSPEGMLACPIPPYSLLSLSPLQNQKADYASDYGECSIFLFSSYPVSTVYVGILQKKREHYPYVSKILHYQEKCSHVVLGYFV